MKKSQAALEFLVTYGWAFLVILVVIAALSYFGILSPSKLLPDRCNFGSEFGCRAFTIAKNGINLRLSNNVGEAVIIDSISVSSEKQTLTCTSPIIGAVWKSGEVKDAPISCDFSNSGLTQGEKGKLNLKLTYYSVRSSSSFSKDVNGEVFTVVQGDILILVYSDSAEVGIVDDAADSNYKLMKSFQAAKSGNFQIKWQAYIQSGTYWWAYKIAKNNGATTLVTGCFTDCDETCHVHQYKQFTDDVSGVNAGDIVELWMVSSTGGCSPVNGNGQTLFAKNFEVYS